MALCFLPALCLPFAHHDTVRFFGKFYTPASSNPVERDPQYSIVYLLGRPLTAEIHQIIYTHVSSLRDLGLVRWLTVSVIAICAGLLANIYYSFGLSVLESLSLSVAVFILPGIQDAVIMLAVQNALAVLAVLWAYLISCRSYKSGFERFFQGLTVFCLILFSMFLYPQCSFFIFVPALVKYLTAPSQKLQTIQIEILRMALLFGLTAVFYYFFVKTFFSFNSARAGSYAFTIDLNFFYWKALSVFSEILPMAFNFWNIHTITWLGLMLMGLTLVLLRRRAILCFLIILSTVSFWLLIRSDLILHRIFFATSALALTSFLIGMRNKYFIICAMIAGMLGAHYLTYYNSLNYYMEGAYIKQRLMAHQKPFSRIHLILPDANGKGYLNQPTVDDTFNARTMSYNFTTDGLNLLRAAMKEDGIPTSMKVYSCEDVQQKCVKQNHKGYQLLVTHSQKGQPVYYSPNMVLIDMSQL